jgi:hypothetical protein
MSYLDYQQPNTEYNEKMIGWKHDIKLKGFFQFVRQYKLQLFWNATVL